MKKVINIGIKFSLVLIGLVLIYFSFGYITSKSSEWSPVISQIVSFTETVSDDEDSPTYKVTYEYEVDGVNYTGSGNVSSQPVVGDKMKVFYNPEDPADTVLSLGEKEWSGVGGMILGLLCMGGAFWDVVKNRLLKWE